MAAHASAPEMKLPEMKLQERQEIAQEHKWNVEALYSSWGTWEEELSQWGREKQKVHWPELAELKDSWSKSPQNMRKLIETYLTIDRNLSKLYTYAHLRHDEDVAEDGAKTAYSRITTLLYALAQEAAWIEPALLALDQKQLEALIQAPELSDHRFHLEKMVRMKPHTLSAEQEELIALAGKSLETSSQAFGAFNNADLKFEDATDSTGKKRELTHGKYLIYLRDSDRKLRESAFKNLHQSFGSYENTLAELLNGQVQQHVFEAKARKYDSCLQAALYPHQIDTNVYKSLIQAVRARLPALHRYMALRKQVMGLDELHLYDLHVPLVKKAEMKFSYEQATDHILASIATLGGDYQKNLSQGLVKDRWVDRYENMRKRSGAYSSGCYDSYPYILMNYHGGFHDMMTLTHESGHSMHSFLSRENQPYHYSRYSIFVAEVASTFHEELLLTHMLKSIKNKEERAFLVNQKLDDLRATLLRQTMFAEFELKIHEFAEEGTPLTPTLLKTEYRKLNEEYFGPDVTIDPESDIEWARIPHFYYNFYVYQYATGISAAHALRERVLGGGEQERKDYLSFLSAGSSLYPTDALRLAGVDMRTKEPVESAMRYFESLVDELEGLLLNK